MKDSKPIPRNVRTRHNIDVDIGYMRLLPGLVPEYEAMQAAKAGHYSWESFNALSYDDRVVCVAQFRMDSIIDKHVQVAIDAYSQAQTRRAKRGR